MIARSARALRLAGILSLTLLVAEAHPHPAGAWLPGVAVAAAADSGASAGSAPASDAAPPADVSIPDYAGYVTDAAGVMDEPSRAKLEAFLDQVQKKTGVQFAVLTVKSTAPLEPSDYKVKVFERWKIGQKGKDNGLLMLVAIDEHQVRFETGYGLEGTLPDGLQSRIFRNDMAPRFKAGDFAGGITQGTLACAARIASEQGVALEWDGSELRYSEGPASSGASRPLDPLTIALIIFFLIAFAIVRLGFLGGGGRGGFGGGGFGGGWGGFGGSWGGGGGGGGGSFGGFGGGSSGGGGGGGSW